jgi:beta-lactamase class A
LLKRIIVIMAGLILIEGFLFSDFQSNQYKIPKTQEELKKFVNSKVKSIKGTTGVYIKHVESGESLGINESRRFQLASVFKIPVLLTLFKQIHLGKISLDDRIMLETKNKTYGSGLLTFMKPGLNLTINDLQLLMMARSDNTATDILFDLVTPQAIKEYMDELGLENTQIDFNTRQLILAYLGLDPHKLLTIAELHMVPDSFWNSKEAHEKQKAFDISDHDTSTPFEIALLLEKCVKGEIINREMSDSILETLKHHTGSELILRYLPFGVTVARKGGSLARYGNYTVLNDAGIIWLPEEAGHLIICLFCNELKEIHYELKDKMGWIARAAYDYFLEKNKKQKKDK